MGNKWVIKRVKDDPIYCSQTVGEQARTAWRAGVVVIDLPGNVSVSSGSISAIEETTDVDDRYKMITAGMDVEPKVIVNDDGSVMANWYKINVGSNGWEKKYASQPNYYKLVDSDNTVWAAVRLPEYKGIYERGANVVLCTDDEAATMYRISNQQSGRHG